MGTMTTSVVLNGKSVLIPKDFFDVGVKASFGDNVQANLSTEEFTFILDGYQAIVDWIAAGRSGGVGIFEGIPLTISANDGVSSVSVFKGIVDLQAGATIQSRLKQAKVKIRQDESLNQLADLLEPIDYGFLKSEGLITSSDYVSVDYVVNQNDNGLETITTFITIYLLSKQLADTIKEVGVSVAIIGGIAVSGVSGPIGAGVYAIAVAILQVVYAATLLVLILDFGKDLLAVLIKPLRTHRAILLKTLISRACQKIGFTLETSISDLDNIVYLPSNRNVDDYGLKNILKSAGSITEGIPNPGDIGYTCPEMFEIVRELFNAKFAIVGNTVQLHTESAPYWLSQSGWIKPSVTRNPEAKADRYNTDEIKGSVLINFSTDVTDEYTIRNYRGTTYQVLTNARTVEKAKNTTIKNADRVAIPFALGSRKAQLNPFEKALVPLAELFDSIAGIFGGRPNLAKSIKTKVGVLEVSNNNHAVAKLLYMEGGRLPSNHRDLLSARTLWDSYHSEKSFVQNNYRRQRRYVDSETIPFNLSDFVTLLNNAYFRDENGAVGKVVDLEWRLNRHVATISYWVQESYTNNLKETFIEPS
jgi:hypothetical protein